MRKDKLIEAIGNGDWGEAFRREFDLVIAANCLQSMLEGKTLYNRVLEERVAERCAPLDEGMRPEHLGVVHVPPNPDAPYRRTDDALSDLSGRSRGAWAILEQDGGYDSYMADGHGGVGTATGHKFRYNSPAAPDLTFIKTYAAVLGSPIYTRRNQIAAEIEAHSVLSGGLAEGLLVRDARINGKLYGKVEVTKLRDDGRVEVKATRRGVRPTQFLLETSGALRIFGLPHVMPPAYEDADNPDRLLSLSERRIAAADAVCREIATAELTTGVLQSGIYRTDGDTLRRRAIAPDGSVAGEFAVGFAEGTDEVLSSSLTLSDAPAQRSP